MATAAPFFFFFDSLVCIKLHDFEIFFNTKIAFAQYGKYIEKLLQYGKFTSKIASNMVSSIEKIAAICYTYNYLPKGYFIYFIY